MTRTCLDLVLSFSLSYATVNAVVGFEWPEYFVPNIVIDDGRLMIDG